MMDTHREYDVALSFAGEDRKYVDLVVTELHKVGIRVFYDHDERAALWGKDLALHLDDVYRSKARYMVMFISKHYVAKFWTRAEFQSAQHRALEDMATEYVLPTRFDDTEVPELPTTIACIDLRRTEPRDLASLIAQKLGKDHQPTEEEVLAQLGENKLVSYVMTNTGLTSCEVAAILCKVDSATDAIMEFLEHVDSSTGCKTLTSLLDYRPDHALGDLNSARRLLGRASLQWASRRKRRS